MIILDRNFSIISDSQQVRLEYESDEKERQDKDGEVIKYTSTETYYYPSVKMALKGYLKYSLKEATGDLKRVLDRIDEVENNINKKF